MSLTSRLRGIGSKSNLDPDPLDRALARVRRPLDRGFERRALGLEEIAALARDVAAHAPATVSSAPRVLVASLRGWVAHNAYELAIAHALRLRGAEVALLTCGGGLPACELGRARRAHPRPCDRCAWLTDRAAAGAGLPTFRLRDTLPWGADARRAPATIETPTEAVDAEEASRISAAWLLKATQLERVPGGAAIARDFAVAGAGVERAAAVILDEFRPDVVFLLNGLFAAERVIRELSLVRGLRAPTYEIAPRGGALVLSQGSPAPDYDVDELWETVRDRPLSESQRAEAVRLLQDRARGVGAHESYYARPEDDPVELRRRLDLQEGRRVVSLFTNVTWDSATIGHDVGFASMFDWVESAIRLAARQDLTLVVRIHPAEGRWGTSEEVQEVIVSRLGAIPPGVRFVSAADALSSYALMDISDLLLTYTTTVGLEAATRGRTVAVAGDTHYRARGFTIDVSGPAELERAMAGEGGPLSPDRVELAIRYAHMFFFRAMIPFPAIDVVGGKVRGFPRSAGDLAPGADPHLDWICDRILDGGHFGLPDEMIAPATAVAG